MPENRLPTAPPSVERLEDELLSIISHELRTPLSSILGYSDILLRGIYGPLNERQTRAQQGIRNNAQRLLQMINDLLDVSKLQAGSIQLAPQPLALRQTIERAAEATRVLAETAQVQLLNEIPPDLPQIAADEERLQQILWNLLSNAIKFTASGGQIRISATLRPLPARALPDAPTGDRGAPPALPRSVEIMVQDTGIGLTAEQIDHIWQRFYQADLTSSRRYGGAGLGLYIVQSLVEMHGGRVWASSPGRDQGTTIHFRLPVAKLAEETPTEKDNQ
jgi:signal transduction histidine kinase